MTLHLGNDFIETLAGLGIVTKGLLGGLVQIVGQV